MTSPAIVVLNAFLDSSDLPKEGLSGLLLKFFWRDALIRRYLDLLFVIQLQFSLNLNLNLNSLLVTRQMTLFHQGVRMGEKLVP